MRLPRQGMIHISELSWDVVMTPESVVQQGTPVRCAVLDVNVPKARISLSLKRMQVRARPWQYLRRDTALPAGALSTNRRDACKMVPHCCSVFLGCKHACIGLSPSPSNVSDDPARNEMLTCTGIHAHTMPAFS